ncbi:histidine kinase [Sphingomonas sp. SFZ2018-12]|uniref:sensor histidine kinase n=1 Tax=Sphingomonas sp. SFZ2018-12 TaxID=2683197 RepID=UPI001F0D9048|nr:PAS domain-containing sensor histidine kinase [Sphingomonas sp. SFZ2018-12]MCH4892734.1 histidine kinase [Sphingomonas sp. SFZ2018-12]
MTIAEPIALLVLGAVLAILVALAGYAFYRSVQGARIARVQRAEAERAHALIGHSPAMAMRVDPDQRVSLPLALVDRLGFGRAPERLEELRNEPGVVAETEFPDGARLVAAIIEAQSAARPFRLALRPPGSARRLIAIGDRAPETLGPAGTVIVWFFDATDIQTELDRAESEADRLRAAFESLTGLIEAAPMPMWYRGPDLRLAMVNSAYVQAVEMSDAAGVIARQVELVETAGHLGPIVNAAEARDSGRAQVTALPATIGGARRMLRFHDVPMPDGGTAGYAIDIEELEQARAGIKRFADAQRSMLDRLSSAVAQFGADRTLVFCNQPFQRIFAMRPEWLADRPEFDRVLERMREANRLPEVRDFPGWKAERRAWFHATQDEIEENWHLPGSVHLRVVAQPLPEGGLLMIFEDRTEQVQLASARDTLLRVRTATFDNLFEALGVFSADGRLQIWNAKFRQVWALEESFLSTHPRVDLLAEEVAPRLANPARSSLIPDLVRSAANERQQRGGRVAFADGRHYEFGAVPLPDGNALLTMIDISDSRRIEQALRDRNDALEAADRVKTAFVANMSYELRTPLTSIKGFAEMLHAGYAGELSESGSSYVGAILESVERLGGLVDDVLDLTATEAAALDVQPVDLDATARAAAEHLVSLARERGIELAVDVQRSSGTVQGDPRRLRQAIEHMLRHALCTLDEGNRVLLHVDGTREAARVVVSDDGAGMSPSAQARAFDRFAQPAVARPGDRHLGLDLPLAKQFIEVHGGELSLVSELGHGTILTATLPRK